MYHGLNSLFHVAHVGNPVIQIIETLDDPILRLSDYRDLKCKQSSFMLRKILGFQGDILSFAVQVISFGK